MATLMFAFGSNLDEDQMRKRCPGAKTSGSSTSRLIYVVAARGGGDYKEIRTRGALFRARIDLRPGGPLSRTRA